jgi:hypothetical protein
MSAETLSPESYRPWLNPKFAPTAADRKLFGSHQLVRPILLDKPADVPDDHVAYNPSGIWSGRLNNGDSLDFMFVRVEPNRSDALSSHLGKAVVRPYIIDPFNPRQALVPLYDAPEFTGEDASITRAKRKLGNGVIETVWLLSFVNVVPHPIRKNEVLSLRTDFYAAKDLNKLEKFAEGPVGEKDIRSGSADGFLETERLTIGRPQLPDVKDNGNISQVKVKGLDRLDTAAIANAPIIDEDLYPVGSGVWGGVNDVIRVGRYQYELFSHRAWRVGHTGEGRHYESVLYGYDSRDNRVVELGVLATAANFPGGVVKDDKVVDLTDVVFSGGYNGRLDIATFGVGDGNIGLAHVNRRGATLR